MGSEAFKCSVVLKIMAKNNFVLLLESFIANVLTYVCKGHLKTKFKCMCVIVCSLVMSPFSCDYMKNGYLKYQQCFDLFAYVQY